MTPNEIRLVALDWAGTIIDYGCLAPFGAFVEVFRADGVEVTPAEARAPMGLHKKDHIREMLRQPALAEKWRVAHGNDWAEADVERMYAAVTPAQLLAVDAHADLIPGAADAVNEARRRGVMVGGTTGYFVAAAEGCYAAAERQGLTLDAKICADEVPAGRPAPWMIFRLMEQTGVYPPSAVLKLGDTPADVAEGLSAGVWSCAVVDTGNEVGLTAAEFAALEPAEREARRVAARERLTAAGAHAIIDDITGLTGLIDEINRRIRSGGRP